MSIDELIRRVGGASGIWKSLTVRQREVVSIWPDAWMAASEVLGMRIAGNTASVLADKGIFLRRSDPNVWGRSQYQLSQLGHALRALASKPAEGEGL